MSELVIKAGGVTKRRDIDLRAVSDMADLQRLVADVCKKLGTDMSSGGLRMQYTDARGQTLTVSRSTTIESIRMAETLLLVPKESSGGSGKATRSGRPSRLSGGAGME